MSMTLTVHDHENVHVLIGALAVFRDCITRQEGTSIADLVYMIKTTDRICTMITSLQLLCAFETPPHEPPASPEFMFDIMFDVMKEI